MATKEQATEPAKALAPVKPIDNVRNTLEQLKPQMRLALPKHLTADRLCRIVMTAVQNTPKLLECDRRSFFAAVMSCAQLGLEPDGVLGQAYLIPFGQGDRAKVQLIIGYKGLISLARNSGDVVSIAAHEVCRNDHFKYVFGLEEKLEHIPATGERGEVTHFYAVAQFKGGGHHFDVMTRAEVEAVRDASSGYKTAVRFAKAGQEPNSPWVQSFVEMGKKSAIRRIAKYLPMNVQKAAAISEMYEAGRHADLGDAGELRVDPAPIGDVIDAEPMPESSNLDSFAEESAA